MPRLDASGRLAISGVGGAVSVNAEVICPRGTYAQWLDRSRQVAVYQSGREDRHWCIETCDLSLTPYRYGRLADMGCYELAASAGRWTALILGGATGSLGWHSGAGTSLVGTDGRGAAGPDGTLPLLVNRDAGEGQQLHAPDGSVTEIPGKAPYGLQILGAGQAVWNDGSLGIPTPKRLPGGQNGLRVTAPDGRIWWVEWLDPRGLVAYPDDSVVGHLIAPLAYHHDAVVTPDGRLVVAYSVGVGEAPDELRLVPNVWDLETTDLSVPAQPIPRIGRACWLGFANFVQPTASQPANCSWDVAFGHSTGLIKSGGQLVAQWLDVEHEGNTPEAYDIAIREARRQRPGVPVVAYWPRAVQGGPVPHCDHVGIEGYRLKDEPIEAFEARVLKAVRRCSSVALVALCSTSNDSLHKDIASVAAIYARLAKVCSWIKFILVFSGDGRQFGLNDHPEVRPLWEKVFAGITGAPPIDPPTGDDLVNPKIEWKTYGKTIQRGQDYHLYFGIGDGYEIELQKDERDSLHAAIYKDGVLLDRSVSERIVTVKE